MDNFIDGGFLLGFYCLGVSVALGLGWIAWKLCSGRPWFERLLDRLEAGR